MKVTYVGNTERNGKKRKITYTGTLGPSAAQDRRGPKATYVGVDTSKGSSDGVAWHTDKAAMQANKEYFSSKKQNDYNISALGAGNYGADKQANEGYNYGKGLLKAGGMGLSAIARDVTTPLALGERTVAKGWNALFGNIAPMNERGFFNAWDENIALEQEGLQQKYAENTAKGGQYAEKGENLLASAVEALPSLAIAFASGGTSAAAKTGTLAAQTAAKSSPALVQTLKNVAAARAKDPNYLSSAAQIFSHSYNDAKEEGVDDKRAALYAIGNALLGSEIEISGGIQNLPGKVANQAAWRTLVNTMLDEGKEEVLQGIIDRTLQNAVYDADNPYFGVNENAIFDPGTAAEEFAGGAIVGGLLSGGTMGVNALGNRVAYGAAKAQYNRDVQQNTAPEMNAKSAEAVEAVTRGETITGNQAAAIARDPVAVEVLEQRTGVKLDTDKPISQVKRDIAGLASREVTQETQRATPPFPAAQKRAEKRVGGFLENGQKAYQEMSWTAEDAPSLYAGFSSVYNAGLNGIEADKAKGKYAAMLTPEQRYAAYNAGLEDARTQVARENAEVASVTTTAGAGLADNEYSRYLIAAKKDTAATLNTWGKKLGVRIEIVDQVLGGRANGQYIKEQNLIQIAADSGKPLLNVTAHEITHRMQDLSPAEYRKFRQAAVEYKMQENGADTEAEIVERYMETAEQEGVTLTRDDVMDELAADFAGDMLDDAALFAKFSKENRTAAQKLLDSLKEFLNKVRGLFTGKYRDMAAQEAYGKDFAELEDIAKQWQAAFDAAERQAEKAKTGAGEGDGKYMLKKSGIDKYYARQIDQWDGKDHGGSFRVGSVSDALLKVGVPNADIWFDQSKAAKQLSGKSEITKSILKKIPEVLEHPIAISESYDNTIMVFGQLFDGGGRPIVVAVRISSANRRNHISVVNKVRSVGTRSHNLNTLLSEDKLLYLGENKKETKKWFNALGRSTPFGGTKFGLIRSISNVSENVKPQFSLKAPVEETKNLLALHNLTEKNLLDAAKLGGLPMPSIAIVKADEGHGEYGDISFVFSKDTIDQQLFRSNKVYGYDAWTPTAPQIEYEVNEKSAKKIHDLFYRMERSKGRSFADPLYSAANTLEDELNRKGGVDKIISSMRDDPRVMNIYLEDTGRGAVENVIKREVTRMDDNQQEMASFLIRELGDGVVSDFRAKGGESPIAARKLWFKEHGEALNAALQKYYEKLGLPAKDAADVVNAETVAAKTRYMLDTRKYLTGNTETVTEEVDRDATNKAIRDKVNQKEYEQWLDDLFDGVVKNEGIYNGKDYYTSSGNRRSFSATHYEITLENIVKAMKQGDQKGANTFFGGQAIWGVASKDYGSIADIKRDSGRLQKMTEEEYSAIRQKYSERLSYTINIQHLLSLVKLLNPRHIHRNVRL